MSDLKPFENIGSLYHTQFPNVVLDKVQPQCTPSEWKALSMIIRYTLGFADKSNPGQRISKARFSVRFCASVCNISKNTANKALKGLRSKLMVNVHYAKREDEPFAYELNPDYILEGVPESGTPRVSDSGTGGVPKIGTNKRKQKNSYINNKNNYAPCPTCSRVGSHAEGCTHV